MTLDTLLALTVSGCSRVAGSELGRSPLTDAADEIESRSSTQSLKVIRHQRSKEKSEPPIL